MLTSKSWPKKTQQEQQQIKKDLNNCLTYLSEHAPKKPFPQNLYESLLALRNKYYNSEATPLDLTPQSFIMDNEEDSKNACLLLKQTFHTQGLLQQTSTVSLGKKEIDEGEQALKQETTMTNPSAREEAEKKITQGKHKQQEAIDKTIDRMFNNEREQIDDFKQKTKNQIKNTCNIHEETILDSFTQQILLGMAIDALPDIPSISEIKASLSAAGLNEAAITSTSFNPLDLSLDEKSFARIWPEIRQIDSQAVEISHQRFITLGNAPPGSPATAWSFIIRSRINKEGKQTTTTEFQKIV